MPVRQSSPHYPTDSFIPRPDPPSGHQDTKVDSPEQPHQAPEQDPLVYRHDREAEQRHKRPQLPASRHERVRLRLDGRKDLGCARAAHAADPDDEEDGVDERGERLVQREFLQDVGDVGAGGFLVG